MKTLLITISFLVAATCLVANAHVPPVNGPIKLAGEFPDDFEGTDVRQRSSISFISGPINGTCTFNHHSGFEGFALNASCMTEKGRVYGRTGFTVDKNRKLVWEGGLTLNLFEGEERWKSFQYSCTKKDATAMICVSKGKGEPHVGSFKNQFPFTIEEDAEHRFTMFAKNPWMPCEVKSRDSKIEVRCFSIDGFFVGHTRSGAKPWDVSGEFSTFYGPGNYLKMQTDCEAAPEGNRLVTTCPATQK